MAKTLLNIVTVAHRATLEEQDDPVLWLTAVLKGAGAGVGVVLRGAAVGYASRLQDATGLRFGARAQTQPPRIAEDLLRLVQKGVAVRYVAEDAAERGLSPAEFVEGVTPVGRADLPTLFAEHDLVWSW